ncbi:DUF3618 domain-containing protein [Brevibacterium renqingii]|uniref:DUF3618 domain-containing protein n=1 Tax=Brevibacterium renqingii TaxID=2776916 RepID=UPI00265738EF|nr:DUF3618 domain-containing protein [Brevibacterium renqingii]
MSQPPEQIRRDIEATRAELGADVDAVEHKVSPSSIAQRGMDDARGKAQQLKNRIMGEADHTGDSGATTQDVMQDKAQDAADAVRDTPRMVKEQTQGSPVAAGLIAFGAGLLAAALLPASQKEKDAAQRIKDESEPLVSDIKDAAKEVAEDMKQPSKEAAAEVKDTAQGAAENVKDEGQDAAQDVKDQAEEARSTISDSGGSAPASGTGAGTSGAGGSGASASGAGGTSAGVSGPDGTPGRLGEPPRIAPQTDQPGARH